jgi:hypothetical protein
MAQLRIYKIPGLPIGTAYINGGPMWRLRGATPDGEHLRNILRAIQSEYCHRRKLFVRIIPRLVENGQGDLIRTVYSEEGFQRSEDTVETAVLDLSRSLEELRENLDRTWRQSLCKAEKANLQVIEGDDERISEMVVKVAAEMKDRKKYFGGDQSAAILAQKNLPENLKLKMAVCLVDGQPIAALGWPTLGRTGIPLVGGTGKDALKSGASYVLWWKMIESCKSAGMLALDTGGVNKERNPGGYLFKTHLVGKQFTKPDQYIGCFDACESSLTRFVWKTVYASRTNYANFRRRWAAKKRAAAKEAEAASATVS